MFKNSIIFLKPSIQLQYSLYILWNMCYEIIKY